ncbi:MAG: AMP-binding protein [Burkholderiaceae bacterium]|jgi:long-chain acyl-CoA synthetase|nr:AMP-binding protein [Burkholderiaceae bacterium]
MLKIKETTVPATTPSHALEDNLISRVTLGDTLHRSARKFQGKIALIEGEQRVSYTQLDADSNRFAYHLLARGLKPGDKVAMVCGNSIAFMVAAYGILKAGLVWVPVNIMLNVDDVRYAVEHAEARLLILDDQFHAKLLPVARQLGLPVLVCETAGGPALPQDELQTLAQALRDQPVTLPEVIIDDRDLALIMYTSGTTGRSKGAMHSHRSVHSALVSNIAAFGNTPSDVFSCFLPLFHCAQFGTAATALLTGSSVVIQRGFDATAYLDAVHRHRITMMSGLPLMYAAILNHPERARHDLTSLRLCVYAMAPMPAPMLRRLMAEICPNFSLGSGQTEIWPVTQYFAPDQQLLRQGNCWGQPCLVNETAIMDDEGNLLGPGQVGEIVHRGPNIMLGYYKDPEATARARRFGWHHTGDLGLWDEDGQLYFKDRMKDMIKTGGENVPSIKVEEVLLRHPAVANAAVVGLPHALWSEAVTAFVTLKPGAVCDADALLAHCREHLASFEVPKHITVLDQLPATATGKIQKHVLRGDYRTLFDDSVE